MNYTVICLCNYELRACINRKAKVVFQKHKKIEVSGSQYTDSIEVEHPFDHKHLYIPKPATPVEAPSTHPNLKTGIYSNSLFTKVTFCERNSPRSQSCDDAISAEAVQTFFGCHCVLQHIQTNGAHEFTVQGAGRHGYLQTVRDGLLCVRDTWR